MTNADLAPELDHSYDSDWEPAVDFTPYEDVVPLPSVRAKVAGLGDEDEGVDDGEA